jgi:hypothetical protein
LAPCYEGEPPLCWLPRHIPAQCNSAHLGLIHPPAISDPMPAGPAASATSGVDRCTHRVDGDVVDSDAALGEQLLGVAVGEANAQRPADRQRDHIRREAEPGDGRPWDGTGADAASSHDASLAGRVCSQQLQQRHQACHDRRDLRPRSPHAWQGTLMVCTPARPSPNRPCSPRRSKIASAADRLRQAARYSISSG